MRFSYTEDEVNVKNEKTYEVKNDIHRFSFRFLYLGETFSPVQLIGALVTLAAIYMVNYEKGLE